MHGGWKRQYGSKGVAGPLWILVWLLAMQVAWAQGGVPRLLSVSAIAFDGAGNLYIADAKAQRVFEATLGGVLQVVAGTGTQGFAGDGGPATAAELNEPEGIAVGDDGSIYIADTGNQRVRVIGASGTITTVAGTGTAGFSGDGGSAVLAMVRSPTALAVEASGRLLVCDTDNHRVRAVASGVISTVAGSGVQGFSGDGGPASIAELDAPGGVAVDAEGQILIADTHNQRVRRINSAGVITTFAGNGTAGFAGDSGRAAAAELFSPEQLALLADGSVLVADAGNRRIRRVGTDGIITTLIGSGVEGSASNGSATTGAPLRGPRTVAVSHFGLPVVGDLLDASIAELADGRTLYGPAAIVSGRASTVVAASIGTMVYGRGSLTAAVAGGIGTPQGQVQVQEGGRSLSSATLAGGAATLDLSSLVVGAHTLTLLYGGDGLNPAAASSLTANVSPALLVATAAPATMTYGSAMPALTGALDGVLPQDAAQVSAVYAAAAGGLLPAGSYAIQASLAGAKASNYAVQMAAGSGVLVVTKAAAAATLVAATQVYTGVPTTATAIVASTTQGRPTGTVQFLDGNAVVATGVLTNGVASAMYASAATGSRELSVQYLGDANFLPSTSSRTEMVVGALPDFSVQASGAQTVSTSAGGTATFRLQVGAQPGPFTGAVSFSLQGLPAGASAAFSPPQIVPGAGSATVTVSVQTSAIAATADVAQTRRVHACSFGLALAGWVWTFGRRRKRLCFIASLFAVAALTAIGGCGARSVGEGLDGVVSKSYALQVTGTATNLAGVVVTHTVPLTLTIQQ